MCVTGRATPAHTQHASLAGAILQTSPGISRDRLIALTRRACSTGTSSADFEVVARVRLSTHSTA
jgi:hypothetical protein